MILAGFVIGAAVGAWRAKSRKGNRLDMAQWAAVHAILFGLVALILTIVLGRLG